MSATNTTKITPNCPKPSVCPNSEDIFWLKVLESSVLKSSGPRRKETPSKTWISFSKTWTSWEETLSSNPTVPFRSSRKCSSIPTACSRTMETKCPCDEYSHHFLHLNMRFNRSMRLMFTVIKSRKVLTRPKDKKEHTPLPLWIESVRLTPLRKRF